MRIFRPASLLGVLLLAACAPTTRVPPAPPPPPQFHAVAESSAALDTTPADIAVLNRLSWGAETSDAQLLKREGLQAWLSRQLNPSADDGLPGDAQAQIAAMEISQKPLVQLNDEIREMRQAAQAKKGTPDYDAAQKAYQQKLNSLGARGGDPLAAARSLFPEPAQGTAHLVLDEPFQCQPEQE